MANFYLINTPLINYFFYPAPFNPTGNVTPIAGGKLFFFADEDHELELPTYSDISDPDNPVINTNPIVLGQAGECPLFYLENRLYYIVLTGPDGDIQNPIDTISHYNPATQGDIAGLINNELIINGQFTYPINFQKETPNLATDDINRVAWGCEFLQDSNLTTKNYIEFSDVSNEGIESNPVNELLFTSNQVESNETFKSFRFKFGSVNFGEDQAFTFSGQFQSKTSALIQASLSIEHYYGPGGSDRQLTKLTDFTITPTRTKFVYNFVLPELDDIIVDAPNWVAIVIDIGIDQICQVGFTNISVRPGTFTDPIYYQSGLGLEKGEILGEAAEIFDAGRMEEYAPYRYVNGAIHAIADTGEIVLRPLISPPPFAALCDGSSHSPADFTDYGIPWQRLYNVIGNEFGGSGDLIVTSNGSVVTFTSGSGARSLSNYDPGTSGFSVAEIRKGLRYGISAAITSDTSVTCTWLDDFAVNQVTPDGPSGLNIIKNGLMGNWFEYRTISGFIANPFLSVSTITPGSGASQASALITFNVNSLSGSYTRTVTTAFGSRTANFLEIPTFPSNTRPNNPGPYQTALLFSIDGVIPSQAIIVTTFAIVPFLSTVSLRQNIDTFCKVINNPFIWQVTVNNIPTPGSYFLFSSASTNYYGWYKVNGVGTDPAVVGRTGVEINVFNTTTDDVAALTAEALNSLTFSLPDTADLPTIPASTKLGWFINL